MLSSLHIRDIAIIDELEVEFQPGFNVMTGETGAGKTIIIEALKLVLGARASLEVIRAGRERASVTATFATRGISQAVRQVLEDAGMILEDELVVHRVISTQGKGKIALNGMPVSAQTLRAVALELVDISSQHEHQLLLDAQRHVQMLDAFGGLDDLVEEYRVSHQGWVKAQEELDRLRADEARAKELFDFHRFQLQELEAAQLEPGEDEAIEVERARLKHAVQLKERTAQAEDELAHDGQSAMEHVARAAQALSSCLPFESRAREWQETLERIRIDIEELARELGRYSTDLAADPMRLEELEERHHLLKGLMRKHGGSLASCLERMAALRAEVEKVTSYESFLEEQEGVVRVLAEKRRAAAMALSQARRTEARRMEKLLRAELSALGMAKTEFAAVITLRPEGAWDASGADQIEFQLSPNPGEPLRPLAKIASGGELSRFMLALKGAMASRDASSQTSVFDEVDSGIGGSVASIVGRKLRDLSTSKQVICITHLPQVAALADHHVYISKRMENDRTITVLQRLELDGRVQEVARMLGGDDVTPTAVAHAEELIAGGTA